MYKSVVLVGSFKSFHAEISYRLLFYTSVTLYYVYRARNLVLLVTAWHVLHNAL